MGSGRDARSPSSVDQNLVTAIDIALEPDAAIVQRAEAANARLRKVFPQGYALDATHRPHITMLQRYVHTAELDRLYTAAGDVLAGERPAGWKLRAFKYAYVVWDGGGLTGILIESTDPPHRVPAKADRRSRAVYR